MRFRVPQGPERPCVPAAPLEAMAGAERKKHVRFAGPGQAAAGPGPGPGPRLSAAPHAEVAVVGGRRCGEGAALRWCISAALCAAFLGLVSDTGWAG